MEPVGLAIGVAGALSQVLDCFEYVYLARTFPDSYQSNLLKLDAARLRLSRWGSSINWDEIGQSDKDKAHEFLEHIWRLFGKVKKMSAEFANDHPEEASKAASLEHSKGLDKIADILHEKMRNLSLKRQPTKNYLKTTKWAIYTQEHMNTLVDNITSHTNDLVELFPAAEEKQEVLCQVEMFDFLETLRVLNATIKSQDHMLSEKLSQLIEPTVCCLN